MSFDTFWKRQHFNEDYITMENKKCSVRCNNCMLHFKSEDDLELFTEFSEYSCDVEYFKGCPNCKTDQYLMDIEE